MNNIFLAKAKGLAEVLAYQLTESTSNKVDDLTLPVNPSLILKLAYEDVKSVMTHYCNQMEIVLNPSQTCQYIIYIFEKFFHNLQINLSKNRDFLEEYIRQEIEEAEFEINKIESNLALDDYSSYFDLIRQAFQKILESLGVIPNMSSSFQASICLASRFINEQIFNRLKRCIINLKSKKQDPYDTGFALEEIKAENKHLNDKLDSNLNLLYIKDRIIRELEEKVYKLMADKESLSKENLCQKKIMNNEIQILRANFENKEKILKQALKERDDLIFELESRSRILSQDYNDLHSELNLKSKEPKSSKLYENYLLEKESTSVMQLELNKTHSSSSTLKSIKSTISDMSEALEKLSTDITVILKSRIQHSICREIEITSSKWKDSMKSISEEFLKSVDDAFKTKIAKLYYELNDVKLKLAQANYELVGEKDKCELYLMQIDLLQQENINYRGLLIVKDDLIRNQKENYVAIEEKIISQTKIQEELEIKLHQAKFDFEMCKDEMESVTIVVQDLVVSLK